MKYKYDVFLSYSSKNEAFVSLLYDYLKGHVKIFYDRADVRWGENLPLRVESALNSSKHYMIVVTQDSINSEWVKFERSVGMLKSFACGTNKVLPIIFGMVRVPVGLRVLKGFHVSDVDALRKALPEILKFFVEKG